MGVFNIGPRALITIVVLVVLGAGAWYIQNLQATVVEQQAQLQTAAQKEAALQDSVRTLGSYVTLGGLDRSLFGRYDLPGEVEAPGEVEGDVQESTEVTIAPEAGEGSGHLRPEVRDTVYVYYLDTAVGRYRVQGDLEVIRRTGALSYNLNVQGDPITFRTYQVEIDGLRQTVLDLPSSFQVRGLQTTFRPEVVETPRRWRVRFPVVALRPEEPGFIAYGAELYYYTAPVWGVEGFVEGGLLYNRSSGVQPTLRIGLQF